MECVKDHLPDDRDIHRLPRQWIVNVIYTLVGEAFGTWVSELVKGRNDYVAEKRDLIIELDPQIAAAFRNSVNISSKWTRLAWLIDLNHFCLTLLFSNQGHRCTSSEARQQEEEDSGRDEGAV